MVRRFVLIATIGSLAACSRADVAGIDELEASSSPVVRAASWPSPSPSGTTFTQGALDQFARAIMGQLQSNDAGAAGATLNQAASRSGCDFTWHSGWLRSVKRQASIVEAVADRYVELGADVASFIIERPSEVLAATYPFGAMPRGARYAFVVGVEC